MSSTDFNAPPIRLILLAIVIVVGLHVLTAVAIVAIKAPPPVIESIEVTPSIEIEMITLPIETKVSENKIADAKPVQELKPQSKSVDAGALKPKPKPIEKPLPVTQQKPIKKVPVKQAPKTVTPKPKSNTQPDNPKAVENEPFSHHVTLQKSVSTVQVDNSAAVNERKRLAAQTENTTQEVHAKTIRDAKIAAQVAQKLATEKAAREAQAAQENAVKEAAEKVAQDQAARDKSIQEANAAASNEPVRFTASNANWAGSPPDFSLPNSVKDNARSGYIFNVGLIMRVNKQGNIESGSVNIASSSGNVLVNRAALQQVKRGKFKPFMKDGIPRVGIVTLIISYEVP